MRAGRKRDTAAAATTAAPSTAVIYTTAPADYDWWLTTAVGVAGKIGAKTVRKVEIPIGRIEEQCARYASGLHMAVDEAEWRKLVTYQLAVPRTDE